MQRWAECSPHLPSDTCRGNKLGFVGWSAVADALEAIMSLTSFNGCDQYTNIRAGGMLVMNLENTELSVWGALFLRRSASTLTKLDLR